MANKVQTLGQLLIRKALPEELKSFDKVLDKKGSKVLFEELAKKYPEQYIDTLQKLNDIGRMVSTDYGRNASVSLRDLKTPPLINAYRKRLKERINDISQNSKYTSKQKNDKIIKVMKASLDKLYDGTLSEALDRDNGLALGVGVGYRGNKTQLAQLLLGDLLSADHKGNPIPVPGLHGYGEGVTPLEYWSSSYGTRKAFTDVQFATADAGYLAKQASLLAHRVKVTGNDCGAKEIGTLREGDDPEIIGTYLARDAGTLKAGELLTKKHLQELEGKKVVVRSLLTCQQPDGVCQKCAGKRTGNKFPTVGEFIGIESARTVAEPLTQLALSSKHTGSSVGVNDTNLSEFEKVNQFFQIPKTFVGGSVLAPIDGKVTQIVKAPQGGYYLHVDQEQIYVPSSRALNVKKGDDVEAGDMLTDGTPNPAEIAKYKGLGEGRVYFTEKFGQMLRDSGVGSHRRNIEPLARSFFDKVEITNPDGVADFEVGEIVPYSTLQNKYAPRKGFEVLSTTRSKGKYLEKPVLHYTIGTKISNKIIKQLKANDINVLSVHKDKPGFTPKVVRLMAATTLDPDWKTQMAGFNLKRQFLSNVAKGGTSQKKSTSFVPGLMSPKSM